MTDWRHSGIAFEFGDQIYSEPNRTIMSYTEGVMKKGKDKGIKKEVHTFYVGIVFSIQPFEHGNTFTGTCTHTYVHVHT